MTVTYLFRSSGTGHSIEALFKGIRQEIERQPTVQTQAVCMPHISRSLRNVWQNLRFAARLRADVFHITGDVHYTALALPASRTVLTIHDCITLEKNRNRPLRYALFWLLWFYWPIWRAAVVTTVSEKSRQELIRYVGRVAQKIWVVPNGYNPMLSYQPRRFRYARPVLLQIGTAPHKNLSRLLTAIEGLACTLLIVGPLSRQLTADLNRRGIAYENYLNLSHEEIRELYRRCDLVTFISTYEGFGMPILEANAVGRVVITADRSPMRDVAAEAAHLVDPTDAAAIRQGVLQILEDSSYRQKLIQNGLRNAQRYTMASVARQYEALYRQISSGQPIPEDTP